MLVVKLNSLRVRVSDKSKRLRNSLLNPHHQHVALNCVAFLALASLVFYAAYINGTTTGNWGNWRLLNNSWFAQTPKPSKPSGETVDEKLKSAIIYLANIKRREQLISSLELLFRLFNSHHRYPVVVFYDEKQFDTHAILSRVNVSEVDKNLIHFEYVQFVFPQGFSEANKSQVTVWPHAFPTYNHMIAFWAYYVFHHPLVRKLQYFWRLDTDSYIIEPVKVDLFEMMRTNNYRYGYQHVLPEPDWVVKGLALFIQHYVRKNNVTVTQPDKLADALLGTGENVRVSAYYNNFEIVHVPTFLRSDMEAFRLAFLKTYRIYTHRWGDAPQRYAMVNMFLNMSEVHQVCECSYKHQVLHKVSTC